MYINRLSLEVRSIFLGIFKTSYKVWHKGHIFDGVISHLSSISEKENGQILL